PLSRAHELSPWCRVARDLARMQIASIRISQELLNCHARDVRLKTLLGQVKPFFELMRDLMDHQHVASPRPLSAAELRDLELDTREALLSLQGHGIPDTIGHLDLNPDNIIALSGASVFLDWAEASVGNPFLSFSYLLEFFSREFPGNVAGRLLLV